jgi:FKBP-type peptidyl-prolyl cis-trans isomerase FkpA
MKITTLLSVLIFGAVMFSAGCKKDDVDQAAVDDQIIQDYLEEHNLEATKDSSGIYYIITTVGFGVHPTLTSIVEVNYKGYLTNDTIFDDTEGTPVTFSMYNLIEGWQICIPMLKEGGEGIFFIPSTLGYGGQQVGNIPKNSVLIFEIDLLDVL